MPFMRALAIASAAIAGIALVAIIIATAVEVVLRSGFQISMLFVEEYSGYLVLVVLALGLPLALLDNALLRVDLVYDRIKLWLRDKLDALYGILGLIFCLVCTWQAAILANRSLSFGTFAPTPIMTPIYIPQYVLVAGFTILTLCMAAMVVVGLRRLLFGGSRPGNDAGEGPTS